MNFDDPTYTVLQAANATGWHAQTLRNYLAKGLFAWQESDSRAKVSGSKSLISFRSVLRLGLAYQFWTLGISPKDAFWAAVAFCDVSSPQGGNQFDLARAPCELFPDPYVTLLVWKPGSNAQVVPFAYGAVTDVDQLLHDPFPPNAPKGPVAVVKVDDVWRNVISALGLEG